MSSKDPDFMYVDIVPSTRPCKTASDLIKAPPCALISDQVDELADEVGIDASTDPEIDFLIDLYVRAR